MRTGLVVTALLALAVAVPAAAQRGPWVEVVSAPDSTISLDTASVLSITDDQVEFWAKRQYASAQYWRDTVYDVETSRWRARCGVVSGMTLQSNYYKGEMLAQLGTSFAGKSHWSSRGRSRFTDALIARACEIAAKRRGGT